MNQFKTYLVFVLIVLLAGCASNGKSNSQKIDRISEDELSRIMSKPVAVLSLDDLIRLSKEGAGAEQIIEQIRLSSSTYDLTPTQVVELNKQGVDNKVLDYIHTSREQAVRNSVADALNQREKVKRAEVEKLKRQQWLEQQQRLYSPFCGYGPYGLHPYGYGSFGSRFGHRSRFGMGFGFPLGCW